MRTVEDAISAITACLMICFILQLPAVFVADRAPVQQLAVLLA